MSFPDGFQTRSPEKTGFVVRLRSAASASVFAPYHENVLLNFRTRLWRSPVARPYRACLFPLIPFLSPNSGSVHSCGETVSARPHFRRARVNLPAAARDASAHSFLLLLLLLSSPPRVNNTAANPRIRSRLHIPNLILFARKQVNVRARLPLSGWFCATVHAERVNLSLRSTLHFCRLLISAMRPPPPAARVATCV